jgi:riboflavin kinase/FMN adenylyltransferase
MQVFKLARDCSDYQQGCVVTIGNFDGVHLGHQQMLKKLLNLAKQKKLPTLVVLFEPKPKEYFHPHQAPFLLYGLREKLEVMQSLGIDYVACLNFDLKMASLQPKDFFHEYLCKRLHVKHLVIGEDFCFGKGRAGNAQALGVLAGIEHVGFEVFDFHKIADTKVSSTQIRNLLIHSNFDEVSQLLGRPYFIMGRVGYGRQLGRQLGVPTANIAMQRYKSALHGVFCVKIVSCHSKKEWFGVANIGLRPTVGGHKRILEVHLFNFQGSLYGHYLQVFFLKKIRDEQKFSSLEALTQQIHEDIGFARQWCEC